MVDGPPAVEQTARSPASRPRRPRRTGGQRLLLSVGVLASIASIAAAATVGWAAWKYRSIDRTSVALDDISGQGPSNFLIVGSDTRSKGDPTDPRAVDDHEPLADTIMVMRIDPSKRSARVLSLPRDLWVDLAGTNEKGRINAAYATGGPQRLVDTLQQVLDIPINHYVEVDFAGFQKMVEAIGGVPVWFDRAMRDRNSGLEVLHPGCTTLDGYGALAFARARHLEYFRKGRFAFDGTGDLGRISRQQLFLRRFIDRAKSKGIRNPLTAKRLMDRAIDSVTIDSKLGVGDLLALGKRFSSFKSDSLVSYTVPATPRTTSGGAEILDLDQVASQPILDLFRDRPASTDATTTSSTIKPGEAPVAATAVKLWVLNSSSRKGLAAKAARELSTAGYPVDHWGNGAELDHPSEARTTIRYAPRASGVAKLVAAGLDGTIRTEADPSLDNGQVVVYLGEDFSAVQGQASSPDSGPKAGSSTTTTVPLPPEATEVVGIVPGDPPPGRSCG